MIGTGNNKFDVGYLKHKCFGNEIHAEEGVRAACLVSGPLFINLRDGARSLTV